MNTGGHVKPLQYESHWNRVRHQEEEEEWKKVSGPPRAAPPCAEVVASLGHVPSLFFFHHPKFSQHISTPAVTGRRSLLSSSFVVPSLPAPPSTVEPGPVNARPSMVAVVEYFILRVRPTVLEGRAHV